MRLQSCGLCRRNPSVNIASNWGYLFVWLPLPFLSQIVSEFGQWRLSQKHRVDFPFLRSGRFSLYTVGASSGIKLSSVSCVP